MKYLISILCILFSCFCSSVYAAPNMTVSDADKKHVVKAMQQLAKELGRPIKIDDIKLSPLTGIFEVTSDFNIFYITKDGKYLISGELIDVSKDKKSWSITEQSSRVLRKKALAAIDPKDMIIFPATASKIGAVVVFTDIDCHYCRKLQENIKEYTDAGIEIRYVAFPRTGPNSPSFDKSISVWCSEDRTRSFTVATHAKDTPKKLCKDNPVSAQFELGRRIGVNGTPTIFLENGLKLGGLLEAKDLAKIIKEQSK